tara:strand:- start:554 stop:886 length:333 start_codon:yes stop_codon:yes gene_type:complete
MDNKDSQYDFNHLDMKKLKTKKVIRSLIVIACLALSLFVGFLISINLLVDPIIYWLASTESARVFISCIISWFGVSTLFDLFYKHYRHRKKLKSFNALSIPYPRTFKGRK